MIKLNKYLIELVNHAHLQNNHFPVMPDEIYHACKWAVSKSALDLLHKSPAHFYEYMTNHMPVESDAFRFGSMTHKCVLEPELLDHEYMSETLMGDAGLEDRRTKVYKDAKAALEAKYPKRTLVTTEEYTATKRISNNIRNHSIASSLLSGGRAEVPAFSNIIGDYPSKAKIDYVNDVHGLLIDLKTTQDASEDAFVKSVWNYRYHVQAAYYLDVFNYAQIQHAEQTGLEPKLYNEFFWVAVEKSAPYNVACYVADKDMIERGRAEYQEDMERLSKCIKDDKWPGYPEKITRISLRDWMQKKSL